MRSFRTAAGWLATFVACGFFAVAQAQQQQAAQPQNAPVGAQAAAKKAKNYRRVPRYWGQIDLSETQRERIYKIQETYGRQIEKLEQQIDTMKNEQEQVCLRVLTDQQRVRLAQRIQTTEQEKRARRVRRRQQQAQRP